MRDQPLIAAVAIALGCAFGTTTPIMALDLEGYTEPYRLIQVAADETGTIEEVMVKEGDTVAAGQPLVRLNCEVHEALLAIAEQSMQARGRLDAAEADASMRQLRLMKLQALRVDGHARQEEVDRAVSEVAVSHANLKAAQEDTIAKRLEYEKIKIQIARRVIRAPLAGIISELLKDQGEFVAPNSPDVVSIVQIDTLLANFTFTGYQAQNIQVNDQIEISFIDSNRTTTGIVDYISPVTDAESGTILVKNRVDNHERLFRSGERCKIRVNG